MNNLETFTPLQNQQSKLPQRRNYGRYILFCRDQTNQPKYMLGPHYYIFIIAWLICTILLCLLLMSLYHTLSLVWFILLSMFVFTFQMSYINIGFSTPGIASKFDEPSLQEQTSSKYCKPCKIVRPLGTIHCMDCDVCIQGFDHHCPWIGKCVGSNNIYSFYFFLFMTLATLVMCFIGTIVSNENSGIH